MSDSEEGRVFKCEREMMLIGYRATHKEKEIERERGSER